MYSFEPRLGNILKITEGEIKGQQAIGNSDTNALCIKMFQTKIIFNPSKLNIEFTDSVKVSVISFLSAKQDNSTQSITFIRLLGVWCIGVIPVTLSDYGIKINGSSHDLNFFTIQYSLRSIDQLHVADENGKLRKISKKLVVVGVTYQMTGPLTSEQGKYFSFYTRSGLPFKIECEVLLRNTTSALLFQRVSDNDIWKLYVNRGVLSFYRSSNGTSSISKFTDITIEKNKFYNIKLTSYSPRNSTFKLYVNGVGSKEFTMTNQAINSNESTITAGDSSVVFNNKFVIEGARSALKGAKMTCQMSAATHAVSEENID